MYFGNVVASRLESASRTAKQLERFACLPLEPAKKTVMTTKPSITIVTTLRRPQARRRLIQQLPSLFLLPCLSLAISGPCSPSCHFSTSSWRAYPRDMNRNRGVSALNRTGPRHPLSVSKEALPRPVLDPSKRTTYPVDKDHGLWDFFNKNRTTLSTPEEDDAHGSCHLIRWAHQSNGTVGLETPMN